MWELILPNNEYFNIQRDNDVINDGGFFCQACVIGKPAVEISPDPRYCQSCYDFLLKEAEILHDSKRPKWIPKPQNPQQGAKNQYHVSQVGDAKLSTVEPIEFEVDNFKPRGRPKTYKKRPLPEDKIKQLQGEGLGAKAIATWLKGEQGIIVSYKTVQRLLSGRRNEYQL